MTPPADRGGRAGAGLLAPLGTAAGTAALVAIGLGPLRWPALWQQPRHLAAWIATVGVDGAAIAGCCALAAVVGAWLTLVGLLALVARVNPGGLANRLAWVLSPPALRALLALGVTAAPLAGHAVPAGAAPVAAASTAWGAAPSVGTAPLDPPTITRLGPPPTITRLGTNPGASRIGPPPTMTPLGTPPTITPLDTPPSAVGSRPPPTATAMAPPPTTTPVGPPTATTAPKRETEHPAAGATTPAPGRDAAGAVTAPHTRIVAPGDSFWRIARDLLATRDGGRPDDTAVAEACDQLVAANWSHLPVPGDPDLLLVGQVIVVPPGLLP